MCLRHWGLHVALPVSNSTQPLRTLSFVHSHQGVLSAPQSFLQLSFPPLAQDVFLCRGLGIRRAGPRASFPGRCEWLQTVLAFTDTKDGNCATVYYFGWSCGLPGQDEPSVGLEGGRARRQ